MDLMDKVVSLAKRRGFVYPGSEIYGGLANTYDYGPLGVELLRNIKNLWWETFVTKREDMIGMDSNILMSPKVWEASGHTENFAEVLIDCRGCNLRTRGDHLIEDFFEAKGEGKKVEGFSPSEMKKIIEASKIPCPKCGEYNWTEPKMFNNLFETHVGIISGEKNLAYLRGEIAQGMFVNFKNVIDSVRLKLPFGIAQSGAAFRNEITLGKFIFRTLQFNLSEFEYFFDPERQNWEGLYDFWRGEMWDWTTKKLGIDEGKVRWREHSDKERSHYSKRTEDIDFEFPFGFKELYGLAYRTDYDLKNHMEKSGVDMGYSDPESGRRFIPHVIEPTFGMDRTFLAVLLNGYKEEEVNGKKRVVVKINPVLAPYKVAVFPLLANKTEIVERARAIYKKLLERGIPAAWDDRGNIGKRYFAQDEIGTPWCVTTDFKSLEDGTVTVRDRDSMAQERVDIDKLEAYFENKISG